MNVNISKEFRWEMSHHLPYHEGPCNNIHGHTYRIRIELQGEPTKEGMVLDYYHIKRIISPLIDQLDHSFICDNSDKTMLDFLKTNNFKYYLLPEYTTAENITKFFLKQLIPQFQKYKNLTTVKVRVYETEDVFAEVSANLIESGIV